VRSSDPELRFENQPGAEQCLVYPEAGGQGERRVLAHVNAQGWRGRTIAPAREPGVLRIAALGDSHTFGHGVADDEPWPAVLERELARAGTRVEVLNAGVNGYDAGQEFALLEKRVLPLEPDLVVYGFFCNDLVRPPPAAQAGVDAPSGLSTWLCAHSRFAELIAAALERRAREAAWAAAQARIWDEDSDSWTQLSAAILHARERAQSGGARFAVLLFPLLVPGPSGLISTAAHRRMAQLCAAEQIPCLDLEPCFSGMDLDSLRVHPLDMHAGVEAQHIAGAALARWLRETGQLATARRFQR